MQTFVLKRLFASHLLFVTTLYLCSQVFKTRGNRERLLKNKVIANFLPHNKTQITKEFQLLELVMKQAAQKKLLWHSLILNNKNISNYKFLLSQNYEMETFFKFLGRT